MQIHLRWAVAVALAACGTSQPPPPSPPSDPPAAERKPLTQAECDAQAGTVMGDIGDGATSRPDYLCPSGKPPLGNITPPAGGPVAVEGSVCCPS